MLEGGLCMECLGAQYYDPLTQLCKNCHADCRRCTGPGKFSCAACSPPLHLDKLNNQCVPCCTGNEKGSLTEECCLCDPETGKDSNHELFNVQSYGEDSGFRSIGIGDEQGGFSRNQKARKWLSNKREKRSEVYRKGIRK